MIYDSSPPFSHPFLINLFVLVAFIILWLQISVLQSKTLVLAWCIMLLPFHIVANHKILPMLVLVFGFISTKQLLFIYLKILPNQLNSVTFPYYLLCIKKQCFSVTPSQNTIVWIFFAPVPNFLFYWHHSSVF